MTETRKKMCNPKFNNLRSLRISLKYRPEILKLILKMRQCIRKRNTLLIKLKHRLKEMESNLAKENVSFQSNILPLNNEDIAETNTVSSMETESTKQTSESTDPPINKGAIKKPKTKNRSVQTDIVTDSINKETVPKTKELVNSGWKLSEENETKSIAEQVKEAAQDAMKQFGMVYVESAGMYYDYKTGYYYNSELGLYYHSDTECYYYYSEEKQGFVFHSYPERNAEHSALLAHEKRKARKHKVEEKAEEDIDNLTKNLSQDGEKETNEEDKPKCKKSKKKAKKEVPSPKENKDNQKKTEQIEVNNENASGNKEVEKEKQEDTEKAGKAEELEDGECSDTGSEGLDSDDEEMKSNASTATASDDESIARQHPPCMRVIVRETTLPKLRVGSLYIVTKDGGTIGREGEHHTILLQDHNVSRNHMYIQYDVTQNSYIATDLGSKNGSILNGSRMSESQVYSKPMKIVHGSTLQIGETKLLCHIHQGNDTCGHCEPGLLMEALEKENKVAYTRTCSVKKQHELELARLKNKYGAKPMLAIEATAYNDRAQARRDAVGSSHYAEKTQASDIGTSIPPDNKGFQLLEKMGWIKGEGLGKDSQGGIEPLPLVANAGKTGLGAMPAQPVPIVYNKANQLGPATLRLASRTKMLQPPAKAFQNILDYDSE